MRRLLAALALLSLAACASQQRSPVSLYMKPVQVSVEKRTVAAGVSVAF
jgi:uncharacterized lipoprotein YmbA